MVNHSITNYDIIDICKFLNLKLICVCCKDELEHINIKNGGYIINLQDSEYGGSHWTSFYVNNNNVYYFDSFGEIYPAELVSFCESKNIQASSDIIQHINDTCCGYYCIFFLYWMQNGYNFFNFGELFGTDSLKNNKILQSFFKQIINNNS